MLDEFILSNRDTIIERARVRVAARPSPKPSDLELKNGIPIFLDQLGNALRLAKSSDKIDHAEISKSAGKHGHDLLCMGLTIAQVVHDYGDICQAITGLAIEQKEPFSGEEFRTLNLCLDDAIADAVTEYSHQSKRITTSEDTERLGILAHELRNLVGTATLAFDILKRGQIAPGGSTGLVLGRSLMGLRDLVDRSLADVRLDAGIEHLERMSVATFLADVEVGALIQAKALDLDITVTSVDPTVTIDGDRQILAGALSNLIQNGLKFSRKHGTVSLTARTTADRVLFDVEDECGGLPPGNHEEMFQAYSQRGADRSGVGLGLSICRKAAKAHGGELHVRDLPGKGCIFTLDLPRKPPTPLSLVGGTKREENSPGAIDGANDAKGTGNSSGE